MIDIEVNTGRYRITVKGHALPEESEDYQAICTAVSALTQALAYSIGKCGGDKSALKKMDYRADRGDMLIRAWPEPWAELGIRGIFRCYCDGLEMMAKVRPESVHMIWDGEEIRGEDNSK
jgi:hypothetical protein